MYTLLADTIGEDCPYGIAAFHATFLVAENSTGYPTAESTPDPLGPRNLDHCASTGPTVKTNSNHDTAKTNDLLIEMGPPVVSVLMEVNHDPEVPITPSRCKAVP